MHVCAWARVGAFSRTMSEEGAFRGIHGCRGCIFASLPPQTKTPPPPPLVQESLLSSPRSQDVALLSWSRSGAHLFEHVHAFGARAARSSSPGKTSARTRRAPSKAARVESSSAHKAELPGEHPKPGIRTQGDPAAWGGGGAVRRRQRGP